MTVGPLWSLLGVIHRFVPRLPFASYLGEVSLPVVIPAAINLSGAMVGPSAPWVG